MEKLNKKSITQDDAFRLIEQKLNDEYADLISSNSGKVKIINFSLYFAIQEGSVMGSVYFDLMGKQRKT